MMRFDIYRRRFSIYLLRAFMARSFTSILLCLRRRWWSLILFIIYIRCRCCYAVSFIPSKPLVHCQGVAAPPLCVYFDTFRLIILAGLYRSCRYRTLHWISPPLFILLKVNATLRNTHTFDTHTALPTFLSMMTLISARLHIDALIHALCNDYFRKHYDSNYLASMRTRRFIDS